MNSVRHLAHYYQHLAHSSASSAPDRHSTQVAEPPIAPAPARHFKDGATRPTHASTAGHRQYGPSALQSYPTAVYISIMSVSSPLGPERDCCFPPSSITHAGHLPRYALHGMIVCGCYFMGCCHSYVFAGQDSYQTRLTALPEESRGCTLQSLSRYDAAYCRATSKLTITSSSDSRMASHEHSTRVGIRSSLGASRLHSLHFSVQPISASNFQNTCERPANRRSHPPCCAEISEHTTSLRVGSARMGLSWAEHPALGLDGFLHIWNVPLLPSLLACTWTEYQMRGVVPGAGLPEHMRHRYSRGNAPQTPAFDARCSRFFVCVQWGNGRFKRWRIWTGHGRSSSLYVRVRGLFGSGPFVAGSWPGLSRKRHGRLECQNLSTHQDVLHSPGRSVGFSSV